MLVRLILILIIIGAAYYLYKNILASAKFVKCRKCDGQGYWIAMRGEKEKCDVCRGAGRLNKHV